MNRITLNLEVASRAKKNGSFPVFLRVTEKSHHFKYALGIYVQNRNNFNSQGKYRNWINSKEIYAKVFNEQLNVVMQTAYNMKMKLESRGELTAYNLIKQLKCKNNPDSFLLFVEKVRLELIDKGRYSYSKMYFYLKQKLLLYNNKRDVLFTDLTYSFISGFITFLEKTQSDKTKRHLKKSTIYDLMMVFKMVYKKAIKEEYIINQSNPFDRLDRVIKNRPIKLALTLDELTKINSLKLDYQTELWHVRNYFMFSIYLAGMRISDMMNLKWENICNDRLNFCMQKTKANCSFRITPKAMKILELYKENSNKPSNYVFPIMTFYENKKSRKAPTEVTEHNRRTSRRTVINITLKHLVKEAGIKKNVSFHVARHTFANIANTCIGLNEISQLMKHSSVAMTQNYLNDLDEARLDKSLTQVFDEIHL